MVEFAYDLDGVVRVSVKRAYFAALEAHPPHVDPEGFRRIRSAYEALKHADGLAAAYLSAPFDAAIERARFAELEHRIAEAGRQHHANHASRVRRVDLLRTIMISSYADLVGRFLHPRAPSTEATPMMWDDEGRPAIDCSTTESVSQNRQTSARRASSAS